MRKALREFGAKTRDADVAVMFYAGHGIELDGNNYLIPTDATLETDTDVFDEAFPLDRILVAVEPAKHLRLIILDACRDNPFTKTMKRTIASRAVGRGLAKVEPNSPNTLIAFAAKAGSTASDGDSRNSPFAAALVQYLPKPGLDLRKAFGFVRDDVLKNTSYKQEPYVYGSLGGDDVPLVPAKPVATGPQPNPQDLVRRDYELALQLGTRDGWNAFLAQYTEGFYANLAKGQLNKIAAEDARAAAVEKARFAEQEKLRLASEGAKQAEQAKAAAEAKTAEEARVAAERAKQLEQTKADAGEQARVAAEMVAAAKVAAEKALADKIAAEKEASEKAAAELATKKAAEKKAAADANQKKNESERVASLPPSSDAVTAVPSVTDLVKSLQLELHRVGCFTASANGDWNSASQRSLRLFNKYAGTNFDEKFPKRDLLDTIKAKSGRVCPIICGHGFVASEDQCVELSCAAGSFVNDKNVCEKRREKPARHQEEPRRARPAADEKITVVQTPAQQPSSTKPNHCNDYGQCRDLCLSRGNTGNGCSTFCSRHARC
jgi:hypothetical protein